MAIGESHDMTNSQEGKNLPILHFLDHLEQLTAQSAELTIGGSDLLAQLLDLLRGFQELTQGLIRYEYL